MPAQSKSQQRLFGMLHAYNKGEFRGSKSLKKRLAEMSKHISDEDATHFAETSHEGLPEKKGSYRDIALEKMAERGYEDYLVSKGDTLSGLSRKWNVPQNVIRMFNGMKDDRLMAGNTIRKPLRLTVRVPGQASPQPSQAGARPGQSASVTNASRLNLVSSELHRAFNNPELEAGFLANIDRETGGRFDHSTWEGFKSRPFLKDQKQTGGYGLFQYTGRSLSDYKKYLSDKGIPDSVRSQIEFMKDVYGPTRAGWNRNVGTGSGMTREQYADWIHRRVETPAHVIRGNSAYDQNKIRKATDRHNSFMANSLTMNNGAWAAKGSGTQ